MDSWTEEQSEVWETAMDALHSGRDPEDAGAGRYLLRHLLHMPWRDDRRVGYHVAEDQQNERVRPSHAVS